VTPRVLVADDEPAILDAVSYALRQAGFSVETAGRGDAALELLRTGTFDAVVLDIMLPDRSGFDICRYIRQRSDVPIIMLTARDAEADRVSGLELGADDYVTKPFSSAELVSRIRAILRRQELERARQAQLRFGVFVIDRLAHTVKVAGRPLQLTPSEYQILVLLVESAGAVVSRDTILRHLWGPHQVGDQRVCDVHVSALRRKLHAAGVGADVLVTVRGRGYAVHAGAAR
jgi:DNA-binding response OmpR family regulator